MSIYNHNYSIGFFEIVNGQIINVKTNYVY